jgi:hypothetical protein
MKFNDFRLLLKIIYEIKSLEDFCPQLCNYNKIKRLLALADQLLDATEGGLYE